MSLRRGVPLFPPCADPGAAGDPGSAAKGRPRPRPVSTDTRLQTAPWPASPATIRRSPSPTASHATAWPRRRAAAARRRCGISLGPDLLLGRARRASRRRRAGRSRTAARWAATSPRRRRASPRSCHGGALFRGVPGTIRASPRTTSAPRSRASSAPSSRPKTRFDRAAGCRGRRGGPRARGRALSGFGLLVGKAGCVACHEGWRFCAEAFHDIGLAGADHGRGEELKLAAADHAFKTPSLARAGLDRVLSCMTAALASLEAVVARCAGVFVRRPTLSADLKSRPRPLTEERGQLVAFLGDAVERATRQPGRRRLPAGCRRSARRQGSRSRRAEVRQKGRRFSPGSVMVGGRPGAASSSTTTPAPTTSALDDPRLPAFLFRGAGAGRHGGIVRLSRGGRVSGRLGHPSGDAPRRHGPAKPVRPS